MREMKLVALDIGLAARCEPCIYLHVQKCLEAGATPEQIMETAGGAVMMGGGPMFTYGPAVAAAFDQRPPPRPADRLLVHARVGAVQTSPRLRAAKRPGAVLPGDAVLS